MTSESGALLEIRNLKKHFPVGGGMFGSMTGKKEYLKAVDGISLSIEPGTTYGLVGESGCGKSTTAKMVLMLEEPTEGEILYDGKDAINADKEGKRNYKSSVQAVFQDPWASLNPRMKVESIIAEPLEVNTTMTRAEIRTKVRDILEEVGLQEYQAELYPHEFSGGQRQRIGVARSLALNPKLIVLDEPVSALDVSIQAQVINLLEDLRDEFDLTYLFIAHDLSVVRHLCHRVAVMYLGKLVELADCDELFDNPLNPYTQALLGSVPIPDPEIEQQREHRVIEGEVPSPMNPPSGCVFHPRCPKAVETCKKEIPGLREIKPGHWVACTEV